MFGLVTTLPHSAAHATVFALSKTMVDFLPPSQGRFTVWGVHLRQWWWTGTPRSWCRIPVRSGCILKWLPCSGRSGSPGHLGTQKARIERTGGTHHWLCGTLLSSPAVIQTSRISRPSTTIGPDRWPSGVTTVEWEPRWGTLGWWSGVSSTLPDPLPDVDRHTEVRVTKDGFCRVGDVDYSVPPGLAGRRLQVRVSLSEVVIFSEGRDRPPPSELRPSRRDTGSCPRPAAAANPRSRGTAPRRRPEVPSVDLSRYDALVETAR